MNAIAVLVNDLEFFETMLKNMPKQTNSELVIITDVRVGNIKAEIYKTLRRHCFTARVFDSEQINQFIADELDLMDSGMEFLEEYTMGMNINVVYYLMKHPMSKYTKVFYFDEDVLINADLAQIFEAHEYAFYRYSLSAGLGKQNDIRFNTWHKFAGCSYEEWIAQHICSGHRLYTKTDSFVKEYKRCLERFYNYSPFRAQWNLWKQTGKNKELAFFQDQNFETALAIRSGISNDALKGNYCKLVLSARPMLKDLSIYLKRPILHYACGKDKRMFLGILRAEGVIK